MIPGISELFSISDVSLIEDAIDFEKLNDIVQNRLLDLSEDEAKFAIGYLEKKDFAVDTTLAYFLRDVGVSGEDPYTFATLDLFICMLYLRINDYQNANRWMQIYTKRLDVSDDHSKYYFCYDLLDLSTNP